MVTRWNAHGAQDAGADIGRLRPPRRAWNDAESYARSFIAHHGWRFPNLRDADGTVGNRYGLAGLATTFVLDGSGRIVQDLRGPQTLASLTRALRAAHG